MKQPEALRLAEDLEGWHSNIGLATREGAAEELRRLHEVNQELAEELKIIANGNAVAYKKKGWSHQDVIHEYQMIAQKAIAKAGGAA